MITKIKNRKILTCLGLILIPICYIFTSVSYELWLSIEEIPNIPPRLIPTTEYLFDNPQPIPPIFRGMYPEPGSITASTSELCVEIFVEDSDENKIESPSLRYVVNDKKLALRGIDGHAAIFPAFYHSCVNVELDAGLHLVEVQIITDKWAAFDVFDMVEPLYTYTWAFRVKEQQNTE
jgi:hypothetical protein